MNVNEQIEVFFCAKKAEGRGNSAALDATVAHFDHINPLYVRLHVRHSRFWTA